METTHRQILNGLKGIIDDCSDIVLLEGLEYYLKSMTDRISFKNFCDEMSAIWDSYTDLINALSDADGNGNKR